MPYFNLKFSDTDKELANFAKALALPVRIAIVRIIMTNGNLVSKENLYSIPFNQETITKHLAELKRMGIVKTHGLRSSIKYSLDERLFRQMADGFAMLFENMRAFEHELQNY
ncbi:helix-turn-helix transcriptional regulator [Mucilaginibacter sp. cycad4]|uniref:ArsR/SmtB family transcription factor n=1 Tax=Mucilaginibacter sp. cycad4 TaxID=3342096 RepID=UPI002AAB473C|nr:helix-turn-helix transcriptional regulator [Mucilaginibacter gossypii]WPV02101.1 helix-turn-helix transcriptional regulator [Mucilaginibacter gossypii]